MMQFSLFANSEHASFPLLRYALQLIAENKEAKFSDVASENGVILRMEELCLPFYELLEKKQFSHVNALAQGSYWFYSTSGAKDLLASIIYLVNGIQEFNPTKVDQYHRFPFEKSLQFRLGIIQRNVVQELIDEFCRIHPALNQLASEKRPSRIFLSHDIDFLYKSKNEDGHYLLRSRQWQSIPGLLWRHYFGKPDWCNIEEIVSIEERMGYTSTFYFLPLKNERNADYQFSDEYVKEMFSYLKEKGFGIGLHKSLSSGSFKEELACFSCPVTSQRYHFLGFQLPDAWTQIANAGLDFDTSLGFSNAFGFRNSYGMPFQPYNFDKKQPYPFTEISMHVMDRTFFNAGKSVAMIEEEVCQWITSNQYNAVLAFNFHNNFFSRFTYQGYLRLYQRILTHCRTLGLVDYRSTVTGNKP